MKPVFLRWEDQKYPMSHLKFSNIALDSLQCPTDINVAHILDAVGTFSSVKTNPKIFTEIDYENT